MKFGPTANSRRKSSWAEQQGYSSLSVMIQLLTPGMGSAVVYPHPHPEPESRAYLQANMGMVSSFWETSDSIL